MRNDAYSEPLKIGVVTSNVVKSVLVQKLIDKNTTLKNEAILVLYLIVLQNNVCFLPNAILVLHSNCTLSLQSFIQDNM